MKNCSIQFFQTSITRKSASGDAVISRAVDGNGNVLTETDPNGNETIYTYDAHDRMLTSHGPMGAGQIFTYDGNGNVESETVLNSTGNQVTLKAYDNANRIKAVSLPEGGLNTYIYDGNGNIITETRPNGYHATYDYNNLNLPTRKTINQQTWLLSYDLVGNLITESWPKTSDQSTANLIAYEYDVLNREVLRTDSVGLIQSQAYDADSNLITQVDGNANTISYAYNDLHQRISETKPLGRGHSYTYTLFDELLTDTGPNGTITHGVDQLGRRYSSTGPNDYNMLFAYDLNGNITSQTDSRSITTTFVVNALNQTESQTTGSFSMTMSHDTVGNQLSQTDYRGIVSEFTYDKDNRQLTLTRAGALQSTTTYNQAGLPTVIKDARGNNTVHEYNTQYHKTRTLLPENQIISFSPNAFGDVEFQNNPGPNDITRTYDLRRRLKTETNGAGETTAFEYDLNNNRIAVTKPGGQRWEYDFDAANRLTAVKNIPEAITTSYSYDTADNLETITDAMVRVTTFTFDNRNRKKSKTYPGDGAIIGYDYDANSNLKTITYPNGVIVTHFYDDLNRVYQQTHSGTYGDASVVMTLDGNGNVEHIAENIDGSSYTYSMQYDDLDRMKSKTDRYGNTFFYTYDANGNRKLFRDHDNKVTNYQYDKLNRLKQLDQAGLGAFTWTYDDAGLPKRIDYPNGSEANYGYDNANRIALIDNKQSGVTVTSHAYEYDANGNRDKLTESNIDVSQITTYFYDDADRLVQTNYPSYTSTLTLDKVGNRALEVKIYPMNSVNNITYDYGYNSRDQLTSVSDGDALNITYSYDAFGNQTEKDTNGVITTFDYSPRQRVKSITIGAASPNEYQYDYAGQRINSQTNGMEKHYLYDGLTLVAETNAIGNTLATYHYGQRRQLAESRNGQNSFYLADALGTNVAITNSDGSIQNRMDYDVWGNLNQETASSESPFGFTGYIKDDETDLYYANARYYDSFTGRFLREDPLNGDVNTPPSLHRYLYGYANPTYYVDPTGKYGEVGHYYTTLIVAEALGFSAEDAMTLAFFSQLPDEVDELDAIELVIGRILGSGEIDEIAEERLPGLHALKEALNPLKPGKFGAYSEVETNRTIQAIFNLNGNLAGIGLLVHRLGDSFSHRRLDDESLLYHPDFGHGSHGTMPDIIQRRPELYLKYVRTLTATLANVKGGIDDKELSKITNNIIGKLGLLNTIPTHKNRGSNFPFNSKGLLKTGNDIISMPNDFNNQIVHKSDSELVSESNGMASMLLLQINKIRDAKGLPLLNIGYKPENYSISHFSTNDISIVQALSTLLDSTSQDQNASTIGYSEKFVYDSLIKAMNSLSEVVPLDLENAINANEVLIIVEPKTNELELK